MSHSLSNLTISLPISSKVTNTNFIQLGCPKFPNLLSPIGKRGQNIRIRAMGGDGRDNLDHLQRSSTKKQPQQPNKKVAQVAPVGLWDRFPTARTVQQMMETMESMMEDPFAAAPYGSGSGWPFPAESGGYSRGRTPWEIREGEGDYKMRFDMPGMTKEDVKVWVEEKMLVVKAEKVPKKKNGEESGGEEEIEWSAKSYGRYSSRIALPDNVQFEKIKAEVKDGVLYITIPKASSSSRVLDINVE
ncbi:Small heat shock protein [Actinidia chinensis var. chinensis]|uniref:Small heat shock protein n=1 Tax=Actinidia chinensis var. chinensis TaxID=1590841 RepID=A0A2R6QR92_ACTCC|nr:Small heat shock protein [Actinidia chinensis var. chinensis]